jgi:hypothetical protein
VNIPHPSVASLLCNHGNDRAGRQAARQELVETAEAWARNAALLMGVSLKCEEDIRARARHHRCSNDGSTCLCACHDPTEESSRG